MTNKEITLTYASEIINLSHLAGHTADLLKKAGFLNAKSYLFAGQGLDGIKAEIKDAKDTLLIITGTMMSVFPAEMNALLEHIRTEEPDLFVYVSSSVDFPPGTSYPPSDALVNQSAVTICTKFLKQQ